MNSSNQSRAGWLGPLLSLGAVATCYGTVAAVALLSVIGVSVDIDEATLVKVITGLLALAVAGMAYSFRQHRNARPLVLALAAAATLLWAFYIHYAQLLELGGFAGLIGASVWDIRAKKSGCQCC